MQCENQSRQSFDPILRNSTYIEIYQEDIRDNIKRYVIWTLVMELSCSRRNHIPAYVMCIANTEHMHVPQLSIS